MVTVPHVMVGLERMLHYRGVGLVRFHCTNEYLVNPPNSLFHHIFSKMNGWQINES